MLRVAFKTLGCRLNQAETAQISAAFRDAGYGVVPFESPHDVCVIHSCAITAHAERDSWRAVRHARSQAGHPFVVIAGCAAEVRRTLAEKAPEVLLAGQKEKFQLPALLHRHDPLRFPPPAPDGKALTPLFETTRAWIKVQDGCDFRCAYCVVPMVRGAPRSRALHEIIEEIRRVSDRGHREIVLTGANLGCYRDGTNTLIDLLENALLISGVDRFRLSSIEVSTVERDVIDLMVESPRLCRFLHLPLQSGCDRILSSMGRRYPTSQYRAIIDYAFSRLPLLGLGTDLVVGFPGETHDLFEKTLDFVRDIPFSNIHVFPFSAREGTRARSFPGQVPDMIRSERVAILREVAAEKREAFARQWIGQDADVLIEGFDDQGCGRGWTGEYLPACVRTPLTMKNHIIRFRAQSVDGSTLLGPMDSP